jgi:probable phosphoglycerate mutase
MLRIVLIRAGETDFDDQGRIKGTLDVPLNARGETEVRQEISALAALSIKTLYASPCQSAQQTADVIGRELGLKVRSVDRLHNVDHGLWHGMLIEEVKQRQPKVYRQWQEHPETVCPPQGEPLAIARQRVAEALEKIVRKHRSGTVAIVVPEPLCALVKAWLERTEVGDLWKAECECGGWHLITVGEKAMLESP